jgi:radical SAM protein with 4Fe4S-binding SPASM domain
LADPEFEKRYEILTLNLWGGEPTLRADHIENFVEEFGDHARVRFFIFTNGYKNMDRLKALLLKYNKKTVGVHPKMCIQISYDGMPIHDIHRRNRKGELTSNEVRNMIKWCDDNLTPYVLKSTVTPDTFKYMYEAYSDIKRMSYELGHIGFYKNVNYFPTIDYYESENLSEKDFLRYSDDLEKSLTKIAGEEIIHIGRGDRFFFKWFNPNRAKCSAGKHSIAIDIDGGIYACHGCLYDRDKYSHRLSSVVNGNLDDIFGIKNKFWSAEYEKLQNHEAECEDCTVEFCLRCNHAKYNLSKKTKYLEKWMDFKTQPNLCEFYKINNRVKEAMYVTAARRI